MADSSRPPTITDFLLARIAEDEATAQAAGGLAWHRSLPDDDPWVIDDDSGAVVDSENELVVYDEGRPTRRQADHIGAWGPHRVLAECKAKRAIVDIYLSADVEPYVHDGAEEIEPIIRLLATVYSDHPDYRSEWAV